MKVGFFLSLNDVILSVNYDERSVYMSIKIDKEERDNNINLVVSNDNGEQFRIHYAGGDLYWTMTDYKKDNEFVVEKKDICFYEEMENIFKLIGEDFDYIEWCSEAYGELENANKLLISREDEKFIIKFYHNPNRLFNRKDICAICFCLSGSNKQDIANEFSSMFYRVCSKVNSKKRAR